jgi:hypothetical protein
MNTPALIDHIDKGSRIRFARGVGVDKLYLRSTETGQEVSMPPDVFWNYIGECYKREQIQHYEDFPADYYLPQSPMFFTPPAPATSDFLPSIDWPSVGLGVCVAVMVGLLLLSALGKL